MKQCYYSYFMDEGRETCWILVALPNLHSQCMNNFVVVHHQCPTLCDPMDCSTPGFPVLYHLPELAQTHIHWGGDAIQPSHSLLSPYPPAFNLSQHQGIFQRVNSLHQGAKIWELQLQHQFFQWILEGSTIELGFEPRKLILKNCVLY